MHSHYEGGKEEEGEEEVSISQSEGKGGKQQEALLPSITTPSSIGWWDPLVNLRMAWLLVDKHLVWSPTPSEEGEDFLLSLAIRSS